MIKLSKIFNEETKQVQIGYGEYKDFYINNGYMYQDCQQSDIDNNWYLTEYCLMKTDEEKLQKAKQNKIIEALEKAYDYENKSGTISFDGRLSNTSINSEDSCTQILHIELFNQNKFFQMVIGFTQGILTDEQLYNTKEDTNVYINAQEAQAIYFAIKNATEKLWTVDYLEYKKMINNCTTIDEVNKIIIDY